MLEQVNDFLWAVIVPIKWFNPRIIRLYDRALDTK